MIAHWLTTHGPDNTATWQTCALGTAGGLAAALAVIAAFSPVIALAWFTR